MLGMESGRDPLGTEIAKFLGSFWDVSAIAFSLSETQTGGSKTPFFLGNLALHPGQESGLSGQSTWSQWGSFSDPWTTQALQRKGGFLWDTRVLSAAI